MSLTFDLVKKVFRLCAFGVMNRKDSSWCSLLEDDDVSIILRAFLWKPAKSKDGMHSALQNHEKFA